MIDLNPIILLRILNINGLNLSVKVKAVRQGKIHKTKLYSVYKKPF